MGNINCAVTNYGPPQSLPAVFSHCVGLEELLITVETVPDFTKWYLEETYVGAPMYSSKGISDDDGEEFFGQAFSRSLAKINMNSTELAVSFFNACPNLKKLSFVFKEIGQSFAVDRSQNAQENVTEEDLQASTFANDHFPITVYGDSTEAVKQSGFKDWGFGYNQVATL